LSDSGGNQTLFHNWRYQVSLGCAVCPLFGQGRRIENHDLHQSYNESFILFFLKRVMGIEFGFVREEISIRLSPTKSFPTLVVLEMANIQRNRRRVQLAGWTVRLH
jgi:hypothetical protein